MWCRREFMTSSRIAVWSTLILLVCALTGVTQETRATLSGTITDPTGSAVAAATVRMLNTQTGVEFKTDSSQVGQYRFLFLNPGTYRLTTEIQEFRTFTRDGILLATGQAATCGEPRQPRRTANHEASADSAGNPGAGSHQQLHPIRLDAVLQLRPQFMVGKRRPFEQHCIPDGRRSE